MATKCDYNLIFAIQQGISSIKVEETETGSIIHLVGARNLKDKFSVLAF